MAVGPWFDDNSSAGSALVTAWGAGSRGGEISFIGDSIGGTASNFGRRW